jgi:hypothetical protein
MVALDYCVTYEVSPPSWQAPRCGYGTTQAPHLPQKPRPQAVSS